MVAVIVQIDGYDPVAAAAVSVYAGSHDDPAVCHYNGQTWWPVLGKLPTLRYDLFDGAFTGQITAPSSSLSMQIEPWPNFGRYILADGRLRLWTAGNLPLATTVTLRQVFDNGSSLDIPTAFAAGQATAPLPAAGLALRRIEFVQAGQAYPGYDFSGAALPTGATLTRAGTKRFINAAGTLATAAINTPAFDYDPVTLALRGLLIEPAATNASRDSQAFTTANWFRRGTIIVTDNSIAAPDGTTTGALLAGVRGNGVADIFDVNYARNGRFPNSAALAWSFWIRPVSTSGTLAVQSAFGNPSGDTSVNLALLTPGVWQRVFPGHPAVTTSTAFTSTATGANGLIFLCPAGAPISFYLWGVQLEVGTAPTSYIPTTTASATRAADVLTLAGATIGQAGIPVVDPSEDGTWTLRFDGRVTGQPNIVDGAAQIDFAVDDRWLDTALLTTYAGTTGAEGPASLKGQAKPLAIGVPRYVPGKLVDSVNSVFQVSAYGSVVSFDTAMERLARFSTSVGDYASYAALVAASIPAGRWGSAKAVGMARFGSPPVGQVSFLLQGDNSGTDGHVRKPGAITRRIAALSGGTGKTDDTTLNALDTARPYNLSLYFEDQTTARGVIQNLAASVNAVAGVSWTGKLFVLPVSIGTATVTLAADGSALPPVARVEQIDIASPWQKLAITAERTWAVHTLADIAFTAELIDVGSYASGTTYREGNIVSLTDGSRWLYTATTPTSGNAPAADSSFWTLYSAATITTFRQTAPPAEAVEGNYWTDIDDSNLTMRHCGLGMFINGVEFTLNGQRLDLPWVAVQDQKVLQAIDAAAAVAARVSQAEAALVSIAADGILSRGEKPEVNRQVAAINAEYAGIIAQAASLGITTERTAYITAYNALLAYLAGLASYADTAFDTPIVAATFQSNFNGYYAARTTLLTKNDEVAATRAQWSGVTGTGGQPSGTDVAGTIRPGGGVGSNQVDTAAIISGSVSGFTAVSAGGSSVDLNSIHELAYVTIPSGASIGSSIAAYGQLRYIGGGTAGYPVLRIYRVLATNAASYIASGSGSGRNPASFGSSVGKNTVLLNFANIDLGGTLIHNVAAPVAGDLYVLAADMTVVPPGTPRTFNYRGEVALINLKT